MKPTILSTDLALIRWAVVCQSWAELSSGLQPLLAAFLAGWCCRCIGASQPEDIGQYADSFRVGWREADQSIDIESRIQEKVVRMVTCGWEQSERYRYRILTGSLGLEGSWSDWIEGRPERTDMNKEYQFLRSIT